MFGVHLLRGGFRTVFAGVGTALRAPFFIIDLLKAVLAHKVDIKATPLHEQIPVGLEHDSHTARLTLASANNANDADTTHTNECPNTRE